MIKYKVDLKQAQISLELLGHKKIFRRGDEVKEDAYTKAYPKFFKRIGEIEGVRNFLGEPIFVPDQISEFLEKEKVRKKEKKKKSTLKEVEIDEIAKGEEDGKNKD